MTRLERLVRAKLRKHFDGGLTLKEFHAWFALATLSVTLESPASLRRLVFGAHLYFAEYGRGHRTVADLNAKLAELLTEGETT